MSQGISLIAGLGNPGPEYALTRHNAGFRFLDALLQGRGQWRHEPRFAARTARLVLGDGERWLLCPEAFMNHSGEAVARFAHYYKIPPEQILVAHDDLDLPPGAVRLKHDGGDGGHNGVADVIAQLGTREFHRLRIGIGRPATSAQVVSFVLKKAPAAERTLTDDAMQDALRHIEEIVQGQFQKVMNVLHTHSG